MECFCGGKPVNYTIIPDENFTYLYFTYNHTTQTVTIEGTNVIPEFPSAITLPPFMILTILTIIFAKRKRSKKTSLSNNYLKKQQTVNVSLTEQKRTLGALVWLLLTF